MIPDILLVKIKNCLLPKGKNITQKLNIIDLYKIN